MSHAPGRVGARLWATVLASLLALVGAVAVVQPAHADRVTGELVGAPDLAPGTQSRVHLLGEADAPRWVGTGLFQMRVGNTNLYTYCIDFFTGAQAGKKYEESDWNDTIGASKGARISWILNHAVPFVPVDRVAGAA